MSTPTINAQMDAINGSMATLKGDLATLRPLIKTLKENALNAYPTESLSNQAVASFTDGAKSIPVKSLSVAITPIQNLNGQANPYPAGGGKNKLHLSTNPTTADGVTFTETANGITIQNAPSSSTFVTIFSGTLPVGTYTISDASGGSNSTHQLVLRNSGGVQAYIRDSAYTFSVTDANEGYQVRLYVYSGNTTSLVKPQMESGSTATAYAPYSNICPIVGHTDAKVYRTGKNLFGSIVIEKLNNNGTTTASSNDWHGQRVNVGTERNLTLKIYENTTYTSGSIGVAEYASDGTFIIGGNFVTTNFISSYPYTASRTLNANTAYFILRGYHSGGASGITSIKAQVEFGSSPTTYEPYAGQTYPISLGQTVYGGTLNVKTGVLTVDVAIVDMGDLSYTYRSAKACFDAVPPSAVKAVTAGNLSPLICSTYKTVNAVNYSSWQNTDDKSVFVSPADGYIVVHDTGYTSKSDFTTAVTGQKVVYELATPITVQLSATEVTALLGVNNIWADTGDITEVTIRCDTALYIQKLVG